MQVSPTEIVIEQPQASGVSPELLEELSRLTARCAAGATQARPALAAGISPGTLRDFLEIPQTRLLVARNGGHAAGFALFHLQSQKLPEPVNWFGGAFGALTRWGYGHLVVIDEPYRGPRRSLYARFLAGARGQAASHVDWFWCLARRENPAALRAHLRAGWTPAGVSCALRMGERVHSADLLVLPVDPQAPGDELLRRFRERAAALDERFTVSPLA